MVNKGKRIIRALFLSAFLIFIMVLFTQTLGLAGSGFDTDDTLTRYFFYVAPGLSFLVGLLLFFFVEILIREDDSKYGNSVAYVSQGEFPHLTYFKKFTTIRLIISSIIIFSILGLLTLISQQQTFTGIAVLPNQFSETTSLLFSSALIPASENLGAAFFIAFLLSVFRIAGRKYEFSKGNFIVFTWLIIPLLIGLYGLSNHLLRYGGADLSLLIVFIFWFIGGFITIMTGNFGPFLIMHVVNNFFFDIKRFLSNDIITIYIVALIILLSVGYYFLYIRKKSE